MDPLPSATFSSEHDISLRFLYLIIYVIYAVLFFSISCFFALLCLLLYAYVFPKLPIVKFYRAKAASEGSLTVMADLAAAGIGKHPNPLVFTFLTSSVVFSSLTHLCDGNSFGMDRWPRLEKALHLLNA